MGGIESCKILVNIRSNLSLSSRTIYCYVRSYDGLRLITSGEDDQMVLYDCEKGVERQVIRSQKYGCDLVRFTHAPNTIVYASNKDTKEHDIRYMSLHDNKYLKYLRGHTAKVVSLSVSPVDDTMISGSLDRTVRLWDLRSPEAVGLMQCQVS